MSAYKALQAAQAAQVEVWLEGDRLKLRATRRPPSQILKLLEDNKRAIMAVLRPDDVVWSAEDWKAYYMERVALAQRGYPPAASELIALLDTADRWLTVHPPEISDPHKCSHCNKEMGSAEKVVVTGANDRNGDLHAECAFRWRNFRRLRALAAVGRLIS